MKNKRKLFRIVAAVAVVGLAYVLAVDLWVAGRGGRYVESADQAADGKADCILVLGAGLNEQGQPDFTLADRLTVAIDLYRSGAAAKLLMSGDDGTVGYNEVAAMKAYALARGVAEEDIFMDHAGFSTYESMYRARDVFGARTVIVVTQGYHMGRALYDARALGLDAYGVTSDLRTYGGMTGWRLREVLARNKDFIYAIVKPAPTYLGDAIDLQGDGRVTDPASAG